ncbi:Pyridoxal biosynthesis lyase pdxS, partial [mine drainage metagenome]
EAGTGNVIEAIRHIRQIREEVDLLVRMRPAAAAAWAKKERVSRGVVQEVRRLRRLPVVNFAAGGIATPADAALCRLLGVDGVFVGSGIFKSESPEKIARAVVEASLHFDQPELLARVSEGLGTPMKGIDLSGLRPEEMLQSRESDPRRISAPSAP